MAKVRGIGVAVIAKKCGFNPFDIKSPLCKTPNRCCSSTITRPNDLKTTSFWISEWVPIIISMRPLDKPSRIDSLSLLDIALVSQNIEQKEIDEWYVRKMLGIADRSKILEILKLIFQGDQKNSIAKLRLLLDEGIEPSNFLNDI